MNVYSARLARKNNVTQHLQNYLSKRKEGKQALVFEGQQCSSFYIPFILRKYDFSDENYQLSLDGRENVLEFRRLKLRNKQIQDDNILFFIDRDYVSPSISENCKDVYVTDRYAIENYFIDETTINNFIRTNFCLGDFSDSSEDTKTLMEDIERLYISTLNDYLRLTQKLQKIIYICRVNNINCIPTDKFNFFIKFRDDKDDQFPMKILLNNNTDIFQKLKIPSSDFDRISDLLNQVNEFDDLNPRNDWRGKYHVFFLMKFLNYLIYLRREGKMPFKIKRNPTCGMISQNNLMPCLVSVMQPPKSLELFLNTNMKAREP